MPDCYAKSIDLIPYQVNQSKRGHYFSYYIRALYWQLSKCVHLSRTKKAFDHETSPLVLP